MKRRIPAFLAFLFLLGVLLPGQAPCLDDDLLKHPRDMEFPPLSFQPPRADRTVLSNGMVVYLLENSELPLIRVSALFRTGSVFDPPDKSGLAKITASVLRNGGAGARTPKAVNETLEARAAEIEFSMDRESGSAYLFARKQDFPAVLAVFADLLRKPNFDIDQFDLAKKAQIEAVRRSHDNPEEIAYRELRKALYRGNPRGQEPTVESIERIKWADLTAFHRGFFHPNNTLLGVSGDFKKEEMIQQLERAFAGWDRSIVELPFIPLPSAREERSILHAPKDLPQATVVLGHLSLPLDHPDHYPFKVLNFILGGGGFNSRMTQEIRSNRGLAYGVGSFYSARVGYGVFGAFCQTKSSTTQQVITLLYDLIEGIRKAPPRPEEAEWAKNTLINQFIFSFDSPAEVVRQQMRLEYDGLPADTLEKYRDRVAGVTSGDLARAAREHLHPGKSVLVVVGKEADFEKPLSSLGPVTRVEPETPPPQAGR